VCNHPLSGANITRQLYRIENVGTRQVERITANDEERRRQCYDLQITFSFVGATDTKTRIVQDSGGEILSAEFAPVALVRRINRGLRRRKNQSDVGFWIDPKSGYWASTNGAENGDDASPLKTRQRITPVVEDRKNALLVRFPTPWLAASGEDAAVIIATIQHALARGVEAVYQLEEGEILVEPIPSRSDRRGLLFYESAEGGAGALSRLIDDPSALREVAQKALEIMHYDPESFSEAAKSSPSKLVNIGEARCVAGCYRCLLSYFNQPDQELIDRRKEPVLEFLLRLAFSERADFVGKSTDASPLGGCPPPDRKALTIDGFEIPLIWRSARIAAVEKAIAPSVLSERLAAKGIDLVLLPANDPERGQEIRRLADLLEGKSA
jgi:hypothetical protein